MTCSVCKKFKGDFLNVFWGFSGGFWGFGGVAEFGGVWLSSRSIGDILDTLLLYLISCFLKSSHGLIEVYRLVIKLIYFQPKPLLLCPGYLESKGG